MKKKDLQAGKQRWRRSLCGGSSVRKTIPPQDGLKCLLNGFWVNSLKVDARLRFNSSAY